MSKILDFFRKKYITYPLFWGYHLLFFAVLLFGYELFFIFLSNPLVPWNIALMIYALLLTPIAAVIIALLPKFRKNTSKLLKLFFGVEIPIIILVILRIVFVREMTPIFWLFFISIFVSIAGQLLLLFEIEVKSLIRKASLLISQETSLIIAGYFALLSAFFVPIIIGSIIRLLLEIPYIELINDILTSIWYSKGLSVIFAIYLIFWLLLFFMSIGLFVVTPFISLFIYWCSFIEKINELKEETNIKNVKIIVYGFILVYFIAVLLLSYQENPLWYSNKLEATRIPKSFEDRQVVIKDFIKYQNKLKTTLTSNYLACYRYLGDETINFIENGYENVLEYPNTISKSIQETFNTIASPFIFHGNFSEIRKLANDNYEEIFDSPIQDGQRKEILATLNATNTTDEFKAGLLDKFNKTVRLVSKNINTYTKENDPFAKVTIEEEYENTSNKIQEVYYEFYLPTEASFTNMKLGENLEHDSVISPKGAAQKTYNDQIKYRSDPALLEQTGIKQFKLRVFPIPQKPIRFISTNNKDEKNLKVKYEYIIEKNNIDNTIPLPIITEARNVYSDKKTVFRINGETIPSNTNKTITSIPDKANKIILNKVICSKIHSNYVCFAPNTLNKTKKNNNNINGLKIALMLDASYSNKNVNWSEFFNNSFPISALTKTNQVDAYFFNYEISKKINLNKDIKDLNKLFTITNYGKTTRLNTLQLLPKDYNLVIMLTDSSDFDNYTNPINFSVLPFPVYIVHIYNEIPQYMDELTIELIKDRGYVFTNPQKALEHYVSIKGWGETLLSPGIDIINADNLGVWYSSKAKVNDISGKNSIEYMDTNSNFYKLAVSKLIYSMIRNENVNNLIVLDQIHSLAKENSVVSPYSSLIVLVNDWQKRQLKKAEKQKNRYQAEYDYSKEALSNPSGSSILNVSSVPEPEEWLLLLITLLLLVIFFNKNRILCLVKK